MDDLLNIEKMPTRPGYPYADPRYLTLTDCVYDPEPFEGQRYLLEKRSDLVLSPEEIEKLQNINNVEGKNFSNIHERTEENNYKNVKDPVNVFSSRLEELMLSTGMYSFMLRKRNPKKSQLKDWKFEKETSIFRNKS